MYSFLSSFRKRLAIKNKQYQHEGFTLLELLISLVIAGTVISGLLFVVVELTKIDKRESSLDQVQRDMKRAIDYISDDLQEAVHVYSAPAKIQQIYDELKDDPDFPETATPVLAFWRIDPIKGLDGLPTDCSSISDEDDERTCDVLKIRQASYTLVVYSQQENTDGNRNWLGKSRLIRYELPRFTVAGVSTFTERKGYRDPTDAEDLDASFENWIADTDGTPEGDSAVLVDYVASPTPTVNLNKSPLSDVAADGTSSPCFSYGDDGSNSLYNVVPSTAAVDADNSFFACVRNADPDNDSDTPTAKRANQDVYVFLRGSVEGVAGGASFYSDESSLPIVETRVLVKGIIDKNI
ncbi:MAG: type II secretion system protein [Cyanobacteria bacterium J06634_5]